MAFSFDFDLNFLELPMPKVINFDKIREFISDGSVKRINFKTTHSKALYQFNDGNGILKLPFNEPFESIASVKLGIQKPVLYAHEGKYRRFLSQKVYQDFSNLIKELEELVLLRDCLDLSIALCMHETASKEEGIKRTVLGEHEYQLKYNPNSPEAARALVAITNELQSRLETLPFFKDVDYIVAVPSTKPFLRDVIGKLKDFKFEDISLKVKWTNKTGSSKNSQNPEDKLDLMDSWGFSIDKNLSLDGKNILVLDDMYKSGITMQYVAMKLKEAGAKRVFGISICKALGNN